MPVKKETKAVKQTKNAELYLKEALACVIYLLKNTDSETTTNASNIIKYIKEVYGYEPQRQRISFILNILTKNAFMTRRLGFVVSSRPTGTDKNRKKFYISERLVTMMEINAIHIALMNYKTPLTGSKRIDDIIKGLELIFPTKQDKENNTIEKDCLIPLNKPTKFDYLKQIINASYVKKLSITYKIKGDITEYTGRVKEIYFLGGDKYKVEMFDDEDNKSHTFELSQFASVDITRSEIIKAPDQRQLVGNLNVTPSFGLKHGNVNGFMTTSSLPSFLIKEEKPTEEPIVIEFNFYNMDIIDSFKKEFNIDLYEQLKMNKNISPNSQREFTIEDFPQTDNPSLKVFLPRKKFIEWASRTENILDIEVIKPYDINIEIKERIEAISKMAQTKFRHIIPNEVDGFQIDFIENNEVSIVKVVSNDPVITIPDTIYGRPVTVIGDLACMDKPVEKLILGKNIRRIRLEAFYRCVKLKEVVFNDKLEFIDSEAFAECRSLESIDIHSPLQALLAKSFYDCINLKTVRIHTTNGNYFDIGYDAFLNCTSLEEAEFSTIFAIGSNAFNNCKSLKTLTFLEATLTYHMDEFIDNKNTKIYVRYKDYVPKNSPYERLSCADQIVVLNEK